MPKQKPPERFNELRKKAEKLPAQGATHPPLTTSPPRCIVFDR